MSTTIDYRREAFYWDRSSKNTDYVDREILVLSEIGSSNCYDSQTNRRTRDWEIFAFSSAYSVYGEVARHAASASGGMLVLTRMGTWSPKDYAADLVKVIRAYDRAIKAAPPIEKAFERFLISAELRITKKLEGRDLERVTAFLKKYSLELKERDNYGTPIQAVGLHISNAETLTDVHMFNRGNSTHVSYNISQKGA